MIGLVDGNNFYVSCERVFNLSLMGKPVAVLSNNDGCVVSRSNEFKSLNIPMGTPFFQLKSMIERNGLILISSNYELYADLSRRMIAILYEMTPDVEQYSIDEAFIHVHLPAESNYTEYGRELREKVLKWVGIPCGIGFAKSKTLAKIANHIGKTLPGGVYVMPKETKSVLSEIPIDEIWGVGRRITPKLHAIGIHNAWQLASLDEHFIRRKFNIVLARTVLELRGESIFEHENPEAASQSITCSRSFSHPVTEFSELAESVAHYTARAAEKLRRERQYAAGVNIYFQYYPEYSPLHLEGGITTTTVAFDSPIGSTSLMLKAISPHLQKLYTKNRRYKKTGVIFFGLESATGERQRDFFTDYDREKRELQVAETMDAINRQFGRDTLYNLSEGITRSWSMRRERLSPAFTTRWDQLPEVY